MDTIGLYLVDSNLDLQPALLIYCSGDIYPSFIDQDVIKKDNWDFCYDSESGKLSGYYKLYKFFIKFEIENLKEKLDKDSLNDIINKVTNGIQIRKEDIKPLAEAMYDGQYTECYAVMSDEYSRNKIG